MIIAILMYFIFTSIISTIVYWKNFLYNKKIYNSLSKMIFVNGEYCIKGYLSENKSAVFYYWEGSNSFTLDSKLNIYLRKPFFLLHPYNYYWYLKFIKFILKQKIHTYNEFYDNSKNIFISLKREEVLNNLLNN